MTEKAVKLCDRCGEDEARPKERYCAKCRRLVLKELHASGHCLPVGRLKGSMRTGEHKQARDDDDSGSHDNAVRAMEGD